MPTFRHTGDLGDIIFSLPLVKKLGGGTYYLENRPEITRPLTTEKFESLMELIEAQTYITSVEWFKPGIEIDYDFTHFRSCYRNHQTLCESMGTHIRSMADTSKPWLTTPDPIMHGRPVFARSPRYQNPEWRKVWPEVMRAFPGAIFVGNEDEHSAFEKEFGKVEYQPTKTLLDVLNLIAGSTVFVGNQSSPFALAEGLKHNRILEVCPKIQDCLYRGGKVLHVLSYQDWVPRREADNFILLLQCFDGDIDETEELIELICEIEPVPRKDIEFILSIRRDTNGERAMQLLTKAKAKFPKAFLIRGTRREQGHPAGPNAMWQEAQELVRELQQQGKVHGRYMLTFESDCIPLRPDWINVLKSEWLRLKKPVIGHVHNEPATHINGNLMIDTELTARQRLQIPHARQGWDVAAGPLFLKIGADTNFIAQQYRIKEITEQEVRDLRKNGEIPALFHGIKCPEGRMAVRSMLKDESFHERLK